MDSSNSLREQTFEQDRLTKNWNRNMISINQPWVHTKPWRLTMKLKKWHKVKNKLKGRK